MMHKSKIMPAARINYVTALPSKTNTAAKLLISILNFRMYNILKFTQNSFYYLFHTCLHIHINAL